MCLCQLFISYTKNISNVCSTFYFFQKTTIHPAAILRETETETETERRERERECVCVFMCARERWRKIDAEIV